MVNYEHYFVLQASGTHSYCIWITLNSSPPISPSPHSLVTTILTFDYFIYLLIYFIFLSFLPFLGPLPQHMEVPRLGVQSEL